MAMRGKHSGKTLPAVQVFDQEVAGSMKTSKLVGFWNVSFLVQFILHVHFLDILVQYPDIHTMYVNIACTSFDELHPA